MATITDRLQTDAVEAAIARVLEAERRAQYAVAAAEQAAATAVEEARAAARVIALRTEARIRTARGAFERRTEAEVGALEAAAAEAAVPHDIDDAVRARLDAAIAELAARLTAFVR